jgi:hypothetical protein
MFSQLVGLELVTSKKKIERNSKRYQHTSFGGHLYTQLGTIVTSNTWH